MRMKDRIFNWIATVMIIVAILAMLEIKPGYTHEDTEGRVKTQYGIDGTPINRGEGAKGFHRVTGKVKLASGQAVITISTTIVLGKQDLSFANDSSYSINVWVADTSNTDSYTGYPMSGTQFLIKSSNGSDTATVHYRAEGE